MTEPLRTYGLAPDPDAMRFAVVEGWPVVLSVEESDEREGWVTVRYRTAVAENNFGVGEMAVGLFMPARGIAIALSAFDEPGGDRRALQAVLDQAGPLLERGSSVGEADRG